MAWGDAFKAAWKKATNAARQKVAALAVDAKKKSISYLKKKALETAEDWGEKKKQEAIEWANKKTAEVAEWSKRKTTESVDWLEEKAIEVAPSWAEDGIKKAATWAKEKSHKKIDEAKDKAQKFFTKKVEDAYQTVKNKFRNALIGTKSGEKIDWGDAFKAAWNKATDAARNAVGALATGAKKVKGWAKEKVSEVADWAKEKYTVAKKKAAETADWVKKKTAEAAQWAKDKAVQAATWVKDKAKQGYDWAKDKAVKFGKMAKDAYQAVKKKFGDMVAGATKIICKTTKAIDNVIQKGLDGAAKERAKQKPKGDLLSQAFDVVKPSAKHSWSKAYPQKKGWGSDKDADDKAKSGVKVGVSTEWAKHEDRLLYYGDESNNLQIGSYGSEFKSGVAYDPKKREWTADVVDIGAHVSAASWQTQNKFGEADLVDINTKVDVASLEGKGRVGATWGPDKKEAIAEANLSADLIKGKASGTLNITPKSIWDNTVGRFSWFGKAPKWLDHGISLGAEGEAGIGAGIGGKAGIENNKLVLGGKLGLGPKLGFSLGIGFK